MLNEDWVLRELCAATPQLSAGPLTTAGSDMGLARNTPAAEAFRSEGEGFMAS